MNITEKLIDRNYSYGRQGSEIRRIVMHTYGGGGTSLYDWFNRTAEPASSGSSAHYAVLKDGTVEQYVGDGNTAWAAGDWNENLCAINIEHQDDASPNDSTRTNELYESAAQLVAMKCRQYGIPCRVLSIEEYHNDENGLIPHRYSAKDGRTCPAGLDLERITSRANQILNGNTIPIEYPKSTGNFVTVQPGWGISYVALEAGFPDYASEDSWNRIAKLNGYSNWTEMNLEAGQQLKVIEDEPAPIQTPVVLSPAPQEKPLRVPNRNNNNDTIQLKTENTELTQKLAVKTQENLELSQKVSQLQSDVNSLTAKVNEVIRLSELKEEQIKEHLKTIDDQQIQINGLNQAISNYQRQSHTMSVSHETLKDLEKIAISQHSFKDKVKVVRSKLKFVFLNTSFALIGSVVAYIVATLQNWTPTETQLAMFGGSTAGLTLLKEISKALLTKGTVVVQGYINEELKEAESVFGALEPEITE